MNEEYNLDQAFLAEKENRLHEWVLSFLRSSGNNLKLANKLEKYGQNNVRLLSYPVEKVINIIGADESFKYQEDVSILNDRVSKMVDSIKKGWRPPPIIVTDIWEDEIEIADGGHRQRAIIDLGITEYPMIFYFRSKDRMDEFLRTKI